jgi:hypothetical protein
MALKEPFGTTLSDPDVSIVAHTFEAPGLLKRFIASVERVSMFHLLLYLPLNTGFLFSIKALAASPKSSVR